MNARCDQLDFMRMLLVKCPYPDEMYSTNCYKCSEYINCSVCCHCYGYWSLYSTPREAFIMLYSEGENV